MTTIESTETDRLLSWREVRARIPLARATVYSLRREGKFPEPIPISPGRVAWRESDLARWVEAQAALRRAPRDSRSSAEAK